MIIRLRQSRQEVNQDLDVSVCQLKDEKTKLTEHQSELHKLHMQHDKLKFLHSQATSVSSHVCFVWFKCIIAWNSLFCFFVFLSSHTVHFLVLRLTTYIYLVWNSVILVSKYYIFLLEIWNAVTVEMQIDCKVLESVTGNKMSQCNKTLPNMNSCYCFLTACIRIIY